MGNEIVRRGGDADDDDDDDGEVDFRFSTKSTQHTALFIWLGDEVFVEVWHFQYWRFVQQEEGHTLYYSRVVEPECIKVVERNERQKEEKGRLDFGCAMR